MDPTATTDSPASLKGGPAIGDYGLLGDCATAALVSRGGSIDWLCLPRFDSPSTFARLLDPDAGYCELAPTEPAQVTRRYRGNSFVLETTFTTQGGSATLLDCLSAEGRLPRLLRIVEGITGSVEFEFRVVPRFDHGAIRPLIRRFHAQRFSAIGGGDALRIFAEPGATEDREHELASRFRIGASQRQRFVLEYARPESAVEDWEPDGIDQELERTAAWWADWAAKLQTAETRSGLVLKALTHQQAGAIVAAPTSSLPETPGGERNWDYRYAWVRDASFSSRAFAEIGAEAEADAFRAFVMRSAAGHAEDLQVLYGVGGERRAAPARELALAGFGHARPVRTGNDAAAQVQLDTYGELVNLSWRWHQRGRPPGDDDLRFLVGLIDTAANSWQKPDCGIWEWPAEPDHFVHSKVMCWSALDRGIRMAEGSGLEAPLQDWRAAREEIQDAVECHGYDSERGVYVQAFNRPELDAALLLLPVAGYLDWHDPRMHRTVAAIREELGTGDGLLYRYRRDDGLQGQEGAFLACSFWLAEALARGGDRAAAQQVFTRASAAANDLGLFSEQQDPGSGELLGNFPQGLTHLAHIAAARSLGPATAGKPRHVRRRKPERPGEP